MKVITGKYKGRIIEGYKLEGTRPTMDRVKESLFAMIQEKIPNSVVLDLFSGSGNLGIEALSEGAAKAYLVDSNKKAINVMQKNIKNIGIENAECLYLDYKKALEYLSKQNKKMNLIFLDPPYQTNFIEQSIKIITENDLLADEGIIVCETDKVEKIETKSKYKIVKEKKYGDKYIVLLQKI